MKNFNAEAFNKARALANKVRAQGLRKFESLSVRNEKSGDVGNLYIYKFIGSSWFEEGVTAESVMNALDGMKGVKKLNIFINSEGGDVFDGKAIYTQLKRFSAEKVVYVDGVAASAASFIAMAGDRVVMSPIATMMIHDAWSFAAGNADDLRSTADILDMLSEDIARSYADKSGRTVDEMRKMMLDESWFNAEQAVKEKLADEVAVYDDGVDASASAGATNNKVSIVLNNTHERIANYSAKLLTYRAKRAKDAVKEQVRASPGKRSS